MHQISKLLRVFLIAGVTLLFANPLVAQVPQDASGHPDAAVSVAVKQDLTAENVQAQLAAIEADSSNEDAVKDLLRPKYQQAIDGLKAAALNQAKTEVYRTAIKTAPETAAEVRVSRSAHAFRDAVSLNSEPTLCPSLATPVCESKKVERFGAACTTLRSTIDRIATELDQPGFAIVQLQTELGKALSEFVLARFRLVL